MALFIIGVSVLSIATVYLQRERAASITVQQTIAHELAAEMATSIDQQLGPEVRFENAIGVRCATGPGTGSAQTRAINTVACWQERVGTELPGGAGSIALDESTVPANYAVTVSWSQPRGGLASYTVRVAARFAPAPAKQALVKSTSAAP